MIGWNTDTKRMLKCGTVSVCTPRSLVHVNISFIGSAFTELMSGG